MIADVIIYLASGLIVLGSLFCLLASVGLLRLPDVYTRMHAASKAGSVGAGFVLIAVAVVSQDVAVTLRALVTIVFLLLTTPVSAHLLAKASLKSGNKPHDSTVCNDADAEIQSHS